MFAICEKMPHLKKPTKKPTKKSDISQHLGLEALWAMLVKICNDGLNDWHSHAIAQCSTNLAILLICDFKHCCDIILTPSLQEAELDQSQPSCLDRRQWTTVSNCEPSTDCTIETLHAKSLRKRVAHERYKIHKIRDTIYS
jgi:hypothetical protein